MLNVFAFNLIFIEDGSTPSNEFAMYFIS